MVFLLFIKIQLQRENIGIGYPRLASNICQGIIETDVLEFQAHTKVGLHGVDTVAIKIVNLLNIKNAATQKNHVLEANLNT